MERDLLPQSEIARDCIENVFEARRKGNKEKKKESERVGVESWCSGGVHGCWKLPCEDMKPNSSSFEDGWFAGVVSGVGRTGIPDDKMALCFPPILGDNGDPTTGRLVRHNLVIVVPEDVRWRLRAVRDDTGEVDS